jgi:hypothetical protein
MVSEVGLLPTSRKLALFPCRRSIVSFVAIAKPAPLTDVNSIEKSNTDCADISPRDSPSVNYRNDILVVD